MPTLIIAAPISLNDQNAVHDTPKDTLKNLLRNSIAALRGTRNLTYLLICFGCSVPRALHSSRSLRFIKVF
jgi:hypothetical protein